MKITIQVSAAAIRAVMACAGERDVRFYLNTVALYRGKTGGVLAAATDGTVMAFAFDPAGEWEGDDAGPVLVRRSFSGKSLNTWKESILADIAATKPGKFRADDRVTLEAGELAGMVNPHCARLTFRGVTRENPSALEVARYPDLSAYASPTYTAEPVAFDPALLDRAYMGLYFTQPGRHTHGALFTRGEGAAGVVVGLNRAESPYYAAVVMPVRGKPHEVHASLKNTYANADQGREAWPVQARPVPGLEWLRGALIGD